MKNSTAFYLIAVLAMLFMITYAIKKRKVRGEESVTEIFTDTLITKSCSVNIRRATVYHAVVSQCDADPLITADGSYIDTCLLNKGQLQWVALSQDLVYDEYKASLHKNLFKGRFRFGDTVYVSSTKHSMMNGYYVVRDVMNRRYKQSMDFLMPIKGRRFLGRDFKICKK